MRLKLNHGFDHLIYTDKYILYCRTAAMLIALFSYSWANLSICFKQTTQDLRYLLVFTMLKVLLRVHPDKGLLLLLVVEPVISTGFELDAIGRIRHWLIYLYIKWMVFWSRRVVYNDNGQYLWCCNSFDNVVGNCCWSSVYSFGNEQDLFQMFTLVWTLFNSFTPADRFRLIQSNEWKSPLKFNTRVLSPL